MQLLFEGSDENGGCEGLGIIPGQVNKFDPSIALPVPQIGWNHLIPKCVVLRDGAFTTTRVGARRVSCD